MSRKTHFTTGELAAACGAPVWEVRRVVDALGVEIPRFGPYRLIPGELLERIKAEVARRRDARAAEEGAAHAQ
jgi:hypothetical protein